MRRSSYSAIFRHRPSLKTFDTDSSSKATNSLSSPDRFLPRRRSTLDSAIEGFRANKDPKNLSTDERLFRHKDASPNAFSSRQRVTSPTPITNAPASRRNMSANRSGHGGILCHIEELEAQLTGFRSERSYLPARSSCSKW